MLRQRVALSAVVFALSHPATVAWHDDHNPSPIPTPAPTHRPTHTWPPTQTYSPSSTPTPVPTLNDPGEIEKIWFTAVDVDRVDVRSDDILLSVDICTCYYVSCCAASVQPTRQGPFLPEGLPSFTCVAPTWQVAWEMPRGFDDEGLRIKKYEIELRLLRTHVATYVSYDLDNLKHSFTGLECAKEYRVRVRAWNMFGFDAESLDPTQRARTPNFAKWPRIEDAAAGPWGYSQFRKTRGCPLPAAPSEFVVAGVNKAGLKLTWTSPPPTEQWGNNVGYFAIRYRPKYKTEAPWATAKAGPEDVKKYLFAEKHGLECGLTYEVEIRTVGSKHNKGPWVEGVGSTLAC